MAEETPAILAKFCQKGPKRRKIHSLDMDGVGRAEGALRENRKKLENFWSRIMNCPQFGFTRFSIVFFSCKSFFFEFASVFLRVIKIVSAASPRV